MFEEQIKVFRVTTKDVIKRLEALSNIDIDKLQDSIEECFDNYNVEGEEELIGQNSWCDFQNDGKYELNIAINYDGAYEFTVYVETKNKLCNVVNVL